MQHQIDMSRDPFIFQKKIKMGISITKILRFGGGTHYLLFCLSTSLKIESSISFEKRTGFQLSGDMYHAFTSQFYNGHFYCF